MRQLEIENQLRDVVSRIIVQVELATSQGRTDINLALEDAFIPILKSVYNLPHLVNLNRKQKNFPGIDLGDDHDRVAFQLTSTTTLEKVKATVRQFMDRAYYNTFDELYVLMLTRKQASYSQASITELLTDDKFAFNCKKHIIDLGDLLGLVGGLRLAAQERVLTEFQHILGEVDAFISFSSESIAAPTAITTNLQEIQLPDAVYVAELNVDDKTVVARAKAELGYKGKARSRRSVIKMALLLNGVDTESWVVHDDKLFSFHDIEQSGLDSVVDPGSVERLEAADLADSAEVDNVNILKQLLSAETRQQLKQRQVRNHMDGFFYFAPTEEAQVERRESWVGKRTSIRRVYEVKYQKKDPSKVAHHQHLSFELAFTKLGEAWYAQIVPSWYYSYNGTVQSNWHDELLSQQKRLEHNSSVRNTVRFVAYFLTSTCDAAVVDIGLRFRSLVEFDVREADDDGPADNDDADLDELTEGTAA